MQAELECLRKRFVSAGVTERELREINLELTRQRLKLELCLLRHDVKMVDLNLKTCYVVVMETASDELSSGKLIAEWKLDEMLKELDAVR